MCFEGEEQIILGADIYYVNGVDLTGNAGYMKVNKKGDKINYQIVR
ncbi:MAG: hypothetical protein Ta2D_10030 [Rickettsiales bacterium]|nr:MAG: hypothetical protein Ta2D_10030 [Rickettsiales bacterium]